jgi:hypothetical protein
MLEDALSDPRGFLRARIEAWGAWATAGYNRYGGASVYDEVATFVPMIYPMIPIPAVLRDSTP